MLLHERGQFAGGDVRRPGLARAASRRVAWATAHETHTVQTSVAARSAARQPVGLT